jgi:3-oxoadipate CoA-transferase alpha subunit
MLDKIVPSLADAVSGIRDGATLLISGFGGSGIPTDLLRALVDQGATDLTIVNKCRQRAAGLERTDRSGPRTQSDLLLCALRQSG